MRGVDSRELVLAGCVLWGRAGLGASARGRDAVIRRPPQAQEDWGQVCCPDPVSGRCFPPCSDCERGTLARRRDQILRFKRRDLPPETDPEALATVVRCDMSAGPMGNPLDTAKGAAG
jgi:hypothetical protein